MNPSENIKRCFECGLVRDLRYGLCAACNPPPMSKDAEVPHAETPGLPQNVTLSGEPVDELYHKGNRHEQWLDTVRITAYHDGELTYEYSNDSQKPVRASMAPMLVVDEHGVDVSDQYMTAAGAPPVVPKHSKVSSLDDPDGDIWEIEAADAQVAAASVFDKEVSKLKSPGGSSSSNPAADVARIIDKVLSTQDPLTDDVRRRIVMNKEKALQIRAARQTCATAATTNKVCHICRVGHNQILVVIRHKPMYDNCSKAKT